MRKIDICDTFVVTRMHSSRMSTARSLTASCSIRQGGYMPGGVHATLWTEFLTHACENITFPQLKQRAVNIRIQKLFQLLLIKILIYVFLRDKRMKDSLRPTKELTSIESYEKHGFDAKVRKHRAIQACNVLIRQGPFSPKGFLVLSTSYIISSIGTLPVTGCYLLIGICSCLSNSFFSVRNN